MTDVPDWKAVLDEDMDDEFETELDGAEPGGETADLTALKDCLQALADAIASTNLAVIVGAQGDMQAATARVQASVAGLKRFHDAFKVLKGEDPPAET